MATSHFDPSSIDLIPVHGSHGPRGTKHNRARGRFGRRVVVLIMANQHQAPFTDRAKGERQDRRSMR